MSPIFSFSPLRPHVFCSLFIALKFIQPTHFHPYCMACFAPSLQSCVIRLAIDSFVCIPQKRKCFLFVTFFPVSESWSCMLYVHLCALWYVQTAAVVLARNNNYLCETASTKCFWLMEFVFMMPNLIITYTSCIMIKNLFSSNHFDPKNYSISLKQNVTIASIAALILKIIAKTVCKSCMPRELWPVLEEDVKITRGLTGVCTKAKTN